jgi:Ohr subfamily peroxiredoxin
MKTLPPIAVSISQGGRAGVVATAQHGFALNFKTPADGNDQGLTPEHFFGAAWAVCFGGAVGYCAKEAGHVVDGVTVTAHVQLHAVGSQPFTVELAVGLPGLDEAAAHDVLQKAEAMCAYSKATKGNVSVKITRG